MTSSPSELVADPLFQLNSLLWMAQHLPAQSAIRPVLKDLGFEIYALSPPLSVPLDLRLKASEVGVTIQDSVRPDIVFHKPDERRFAFVECKGNSFSPSSSNASQMRSQLLTTGDRAGEAIGGSSQDVSQSVLTVATADDSVARMGTTVTALKEELVSNGFSPSAFNQVGFVPYPERIALRFEATAREFYGVPTNEVELLRVSENTDPRPLYFIPYDPDLGGVPEAIEFNRRILFERILATIVAAVGRAPLPSTPLVMNMRDLLNDSMFGLFSKWENKDSGRHLVGLCRNFVRMCFNSGYLAPTPASWSNGECHVTIPDVHERDRIIDGLTHLNTERMGRNVRQDTWSQQDIEQY